MKHTNRQYSIYSFLILVVMLIAFACPAWAQTQRDRIQGYAGRGGQRVTTAGTTSSTRVIETFPTCTVTVYLAGTSTLATIYADGSGTARANPFTADANAFYAFYVDRGRYDIRFSGTGITTPFTHADISVGASSGGGGSTGGTYTQLAFDQNPTFPAGVSSHFSLTLTDNVLSSTVTGATTGQTVSIRLCQDVTGVRSFVWPTNFAQAPLISSGANTCIATEWVYDGSLWRQVSATAGDALSLPAGATINVGTNKLVLPSASDTLVSRTSTDTLSNKTLVSPSLTGANIDGLTSGNVTWTGTHSFSNPITSNVALGTAPFSVASTTMIPNLNAELLAGLRITDLDSRYLGASGGGGVSGNLPQNGLSVGTTQLVTANNNVGLQIATPLFGLHQLGGGQRLQAISTPQAPSVTAGTTGTTQYIYYVVAKDRTGKRTLSSPATTINNGAPTPNNTISWAAVEGAASYDVLKTTTSTRLATTTSTSVADTGQATSPYTPPVRNETADSLVDGNITATNNLIATRQIVSDVANGTAPLIVTSGTKVTNLNTDTLDGIDSTGFASSGHNHDGTYAAVTHNHDSLYALINHNHNSTYSPLGHTHTSSPSTFTATGNLVATSQLVSQAATGTQPLTVASTTKVVNLNADTVDGQDSSAFAAANHSHSSHSGNFTATGNLIATSQLVSQAATGTSPITVQSTTKVANLNADTVDGQDSSAFASSSHNHNSSYATVSHNHDTAYVSTSSDDYMSGHLGMGADPAVGRLNVIRVNSGTANRYDFSNRNPTVNFQAYDFVSPQTAVVAYAEGGSNTHAAVGLESRAKTTANNVYSYGVSGFAENAGFGTATSVVGVRGEAVGGGGTANNSIFGVYAVGTSQNTSTGSGNVAYGIYATASNANGTGNVYAGWFQGNTHVQGTFTSSNKQFLIDHPLDPENYNLHHASVEAPRHDLIYRGRAVLNNLSVSVSIDAASNMRAGTFEALTQNAQCFAQNETGFAPVRCTVSGRYVTITTNDPNSTDRIGWLVLAERADPTIKKMDDVDAQGRLIPEELKPEPSAAELKLLEAQTSEDPNVEGTTTTTEMVPMLVGKRGFPLDAELTGTGRKARRTVTIKGTRKKEPKDPKEPKGTQSGLTGLGPAVQ